MENLNDNYRYDHIELDEDEEKLLRKTKEQNAKNKNILKKLLTHILLISFTIFVAFSAFSIVSYCWKDNKLQNNVISNYSLKNENIYYGKTVNEKQIERMINFTSTLPNGIKEIFYKDWVVVVDKQFPVELTNSIVVVENNDYDTSELILGGYTFTQSRVIYVNGNLDDETIYEAFVHEIGHFVSFEYGSQHGSKEWESIYQKGIRSLDVSDYDKSNEAEFFASCFQLYYNEPEKLTVYLDEANSYFKDLLSQEVREDNFLAKYIMGYENTINTIRLYLKRGFSNL